MNRLIAFVAVLALIDQALAHVTFTINTASSGASLMTQLKVPHGCVTHGSDHGDNPTDSTEFATSSLSIHFPAQIPFVLPARVSNWSLNQSYVPSTSLPGSSDTIFTYTADSGFELQSWQLLLIDFSMTMPSPSSSTKYLIPVIQTCSGVSVNWPTNGITVSPDGEDLSNKSILIQKSVDSNVERMAIAAIVLSSVCLFVMLVMMFMFARRNSPASKFQHQPSVSNLQMSSA